ncbi:MAG: hypothetical protein IJB75_01800 [Oscillospiraceae bacterium]|nr:hypothetical protein [Oscillospiraceae bacterium]
MPNDNPTRDRDDVPFLMDQPVCGDQPDSIQQVNRYGTYEIQPTADSHQFFPAIAQGSYSNGKLRKLRRQCRVEAEAQKDRKNY